MKIISIIGARPQFIKASVVSEELRKNFTEVIIHTGQHYDYEMSKLFFEQLNIPKPDYHLNVGSGTHGYQTGEMLKRIEEILIAEKPDLVLTYGDTNSTLAGALAASKMHVKTGHIEAGLRSFDKSMPEEINRIITDHCSDLLFCPTKTAVNNLKSEGITSGVYLTGDVMVDCLLKYIEVAEEKTTILEDLGIDRKRYLVVTIHRASNTDNRANLEQIVGALSEINEPIIFPIHPRTRKRLIEFGLYDKLINQKNIKVIQPAGYLEFLMLMKNARIIITDSGGIQKEAYILKVPCITLRENTEWVETVQDGWNVLVGAKKETIVNVCSVEESNKSYNNHFGRGNASGKIVQYLNN
jgi:UDP-N-acetylglucosamine 2-epimerase